MESGQGEAGFERSREEYIYVTTHRCWVYGDSVNTDVIFPGRYTYTVTAPDEIAAHALEDLDGTFAKNVQPGDVIVAGRNWGCGSSREQAVSALKYAGVGVIVAASFSRIYFRNCINQGVLPIVCPGLNDARPNGRYDPDRPRRRADHRRGADVHHSAPVAIRAGDSRRGRAGADVAAAVQDACPSRSRLSPEAP